MSIKDFEFVAFEFPRTKDGQFIIALDDTGILRSRREQLGFTMQQVAEMCNIQFSQYQKLESGERILGGCSMKTGLAVCAALLLDPYEMVAVNVKQKTDLKPQTVIDKKIDLPKRAGRRQIRKDIMTVYLNFEDYSMLIPYDVLAHIGIDGKLPSHIQLMWDLDSRRIVIRPANKNTEEALDVPAEEYEGSLLSLPTILADNPISAMNWADVPHAVEGRLVKDQEGKIALLFDLNTAKSVENVTGCFVVPECLTEDDDWDEFDEEE